MKCVSSMIKRMFECDNCVTEQRKVGKVQEVKDD